MADNQPSPATRHEELTLGDKVTAQADGSPPTEAAAIIVIETIQGRLLHAAPMIGEDDRVAEIDWDTYRTQVDYMSGGERRLHALADSLATGHPVNLNDALTGLDQNNSQVVLEAIAHTLGLTGALR